MHHGDELLMLCARNRLGQDTSGEILSLLAQEIDWETVIQSGRVNGFVYLLHSTLKNCHEVVPQRILEKMRTLARSYGSQILFLSGFLLRVLSLFDKEKIIAVPFKGPVLSNVIYKDVFFRSFSDLDILVDYRDVPKALNLLKREGFSLDLDLSQRQLRSYIRQEQDMVVMSKDPKVCIELHWEISRRYASRGLDLSYYRDRLVDVQFLDKKVYSLSKEDLLLYLCIHGIKHGWSRLEWSYCVAELVRNHELDWVRAMKIAKEIHCRRILLVSLSLVRHLYQIELPDLIRNEIERDKQIEPLVATIQENMFKKGGPNFDIQTRFSHFQLSVRDSWSDCLNYLFRLIFRPTKKEWKRYRLPDFCTFFYYPLRLIGLVTERIG